MIYEINCESCIHCCNPTTPKICIECCLNGHFAEGIYPNYEPKIKQCFNCKYAHPSLLGWIFCREPERMKHHPKDYSTAIAPEGGYPQSRDHTCPKWELK